jgi:murein DD-endopeptidase MepM/ murein hydrolase activator NlpD
MKRCAAFIKNKIFSAWRAVRARVGRAGSGVKICMGRAAARLCGPRLPRNAPGEALALAAFAFAVMSSPLEPGAESGNGETGLGQPDPHLAIYLDEEYASALEEEAADDTQIPEVPLKNVLSFVTYTVEKGDTISAIAQTMDLNQDSIISCNEIERARSLQIGTQLRIPNMNGIMHTIKAGDTLEKLAETYHVETRELLEVNNIEEFAYEVGQKVFIPEAKLSSLELRRVWGELFRYPVRGWITSRYGYRADPFTGERRFHNGIDIAGAYGAPIEAAMEGRVIETGYNNISGNFVVLAHAGGYVSSYAHMSLIRVKTGQWVKEGHRLGDIGSTGYSTGNHLHFSISRWGKPVNPVLLLH